MDWNHYILTDDLYEENYYYPPPPPPIYDNHASFATASSISFWPDITVQSMRNELMRHCKIGKITMKAQPE